MSVSSPASAHQRLFASVVMSDAAPTAAAPSGAAPPLSPRRSSSFGGSQKDLYVAPEKKSVGEIMEQKEGEDEAMARYKAQLLGGAAAGAAVSEDGDKRRVVPVELRVLLEGRPDIVFDLETASVSTAAMAPMTFVLKEAANYRVQVSFRVQNEICSGLRYRQAVKRGVLTVDKTDEMLGSCAAQFRRNSSAQFRPRTSLTGQTRRRNSAAHFSHRPNPPTQVRARRRQDPHRHVPEARVGDGAVRDARARDLRRRRHVRRRRQRAARGVRLRVLDQKGVGVREPRASRHAHMCVTCRSKT